MDGTIFASGDLRLSSTNSRLGALRSDCRRLGYILLECYDDAWADEMKQVKVSCESTACLQSVVAFNRSYESKNYCHM